MPLEKLKRTDLPQSVYDYAAQHAIGRKLLALLSIPVNQTTIYTDSDILFFPGASDLVNLANSGKTVSRYLPDCACKMDERVIYDEVEKLNSVNGGFIVFKEPLDWSFALERLSKLEELNHYFTEQTLVHLTMYYNPPGISVWRGLVSGATSINPYFAANCCAPAFAIKFSSVQVKPDRKYKTGTG